MIIAVHLHQVSVQCTPVWGTMNGFDVVALTKNYDFRFSVSIKYHFYKNEITASPSRYNIDLKNYENAA